MIIGIGHIKIEIVGTIEANDVIHKIYMPLASNKHKRQNLEINDIKFTVCSRLPYL